MAQDEYYNLDEVIKVWEPSYCDACGRYGQDIVRQNTMDSKLLCKDCWDDALQNIQEVRDGKMSVAEAKRIITVKEIVLRKAQDAER